MLFINWAQWDQTLIMFHLLVVGECIERLKNMYTAIHMHSANEIKKKWKRMRSCSEALTSCERNEVLFDLKKKKKSIVHRLSLVWENKTSFNLCNVFCFGCHILCSYFLKVSLFLTVVKLMTIWKQYKSNFAFDISVVETKLHFSF